MAREFGVKITDDSEPIEDLQYHDCGFICDRTYYPLDQMEGVTFLVHPDGNRIFEPQEGDLMELETKSGKITPWYYVKKKATHCQLHGEYLGDEIVVTKRRRGTMSGIPAKDIVCIKIIQRNGKPFFWPESEE